MTVPPLTPLTSLEHAIVIGGSFGGLTAARVLADHFQRVTISERDRASEGAEFRNGVPQGRQPHVLMRRGQDILAELFPGLFEDIEAAGGCNSMSGKS